MEYIDYVNKIIVRRNPSSTIFLYYCTAGENKAFESSNSRKNVIVENPSFPSVKDFTGYSWLN